MTLAVSLPLAVLLTLSSLHGCTRGAAMIDRNESTAGQPTNLQVGQQLRIRLEQNATTGYSWKLSNPCVSALHLNSDETGPPSTANLGAPRTRTWTFTATAEGSCDLRFAYARPWEKNVTGKVLTFPVAIQPRS